MIQKMRTQRRGASRAKLTREGARGKYSREVVSRREGGNQPKVRGGNKGVNRSQHHNWVKRVRKSKMIEKVMKIHQ